MYTGTLIDDLIKTVQRAEAETTQVAAAPKPKQSGIVGLQMFMHQMQHTQRIRIGIA